MNSMQAKFILEKYCMSIQGHCHRCVFANDSTCYRSLADTTSLNTNVQLLVKYELFDENLLDNNR